MLLTSTPLFGLALAEVYIASDVTTTSGELLPHRFTLTNRICIQRAVYFLLHYLWVTPGRTSECLRIL